MAPSQRQPRGCIGEVMSSPVGLAAIFALGTLIAYDLLPNREKQKIDLYESESQPTPFVEPGDLCNELKSGERWSVRDSAGNTVEGDVGFGPTGEAYVRNEEGMIIHCDKAVQGLKKGKER